MFDNNDKESLCKSKYIRENDEILFEDIKIDHDGFDQYGPESNLYDYLIIIKRNNKILYEIFHREYWYQGEDDEEYSIWNIWDNKKNYKPFENNIIRELGEYENYSSEIFKSIKQKRENLWGYSSMDHRDIVIFLSDCEIVYEWWKDKYLINNLKTKTGINFNKFIQPYLISYNFYLDEN